MSRSCTGPVLEKSVVRQPYSPMPAIPVPCCCGCVFAGIQVGSLARRSLWQEPIRATGCARFTPVSRRHTAGASSGGAFNPQNRLGDQFGLLARGAFRRTYPRGALPIAVRPACQTGFPPATTVQPKSPASTLPLSGKSNLPRAYADARRLGCKTELFRTLLQVLSVHGATLPSAAVHPDLAERHRHHRKCFQRCQSNAADTILLMRDDRVCPAPVLEDALNLRTRVLPSVSAQRLWRASPPLRQPAHCIAGSRRFAFPSFQASA